MGVARRLFGAALVAVSLSVLATILFLVIDDPCGCRNHSDDCGFGYLIGAAYLLPIGLVMFFPAWAVTLSARLALRSRVACGLILSALILGGFVAVAFYARQNPSPQSGGC